MNKDTALQAFVKLYFDTESSVMTELGTAKFEEKHKVMFASQIHHLKAQFGIRRRNIVMALAAADAKDSKTDRHEWRLGTWAKSYPAQPQSVPVATVQAVAKAIQPAKPAKQAVGSAPVTQSVSVGDKKTFCNNLMQTVKSVCKSGLKNNLTTAEIQNVLGIALKEAGEEFRVEQNQLKFTAFMHTNGIDKNTALDILQNM